MNDRFETFTPRARKVLSLSQEEAQRLNQNYIGTEHLLLGLANEGEGIAARVLASLGVTLEQIRTQTIQLVSRTNLFQIAENALVSPPMITFTFTPSTPAMTVIVSFSGLDEGAQHVLRLAHAEAEHIHQDSIGDAHILLGLVLEGRGSAARVLDQHGATIVAVRCALDSITGFDDAQPGQVDVMPRARAVLTNARTESTRLGAPLITPEHILLGLLTLRNGRSIAALRQLDIDPKALYAELSQRVHDDTQTDQPPT